MNKGKTIVPKLFIVIGLIWMVASIFRTEHRATYLSIGVVFLILGVALNRKKRDGS